MIGPVPCGSCGALVVWDGLAWRLRIGIPRRRSTNPGRPRLGPPVLAALPHDCIRDRNTRGVRRIPQMSTPWAGRTAPAVTRKDGAP